MNYQLVIGIKNFVLPLVLLALSVDSLAIDDGGENHEELLLLERQVDKAFYDTADTTFLSEILIQDFIYVHFGASPIQSKADVLESLPQLSEWRRHAMDVRIHGDVAIVSGFITIATSSFKALKFHMQRCYVKKGQNWKLASQHVTLNLREEKGLHSAALQYIYDNYWSKL